MQNVIDTVSTVVSTVSTHASSIANVAASYTGLTSRTVSHTEEVLHKSTLPPGSQCSSMRQMDDEGLAVFENQHVRHEVLVKINKLAVADYSPALPWLKRLGREDQRHGLKEVAELDLVIDGGEKKGIAYYHPLRYFIVTRPMGIDYIGEIEIEKGKCLHVRCHKANPEIQPSFHAIDTRPNEQGGAVFKTGEQLGWFDY